MKIEIESTTGNYFVVKSDGKTSEELGWDELLGLVAALTIPEKKPCVHWMKTDIKNTGIDKPEENEKSKILIAIAYHDLGRVKDILGTKNINLDRCDVKSMFHPVKFDAVYYNHTVMRIVNCHPENMTWAEWLGEMIDTLCEDEYIYTYSYD